MAPNHRKWRHILKFVSRMAEAVTSEAVLMLADKVTSDKENDPLPRPRFSCPVCSATYSSQKGLSKHLKDKHQPKDEPLACQLCGKRLGLSVLV